MSETDYRDRIVSKLKKAYRRDGNWRAVGERFGISPAMADRLVIEPGYEPKDPAIRCKLGFPSLVLAAACPSCGEVHTKKSCPYKRKYRTLDQVPTDLLAQWFIHREEI